MLIRHGSIRRQTVEKKTSRWLQINCQFTIIYHFQRYYIDPQIIMNHHYQPLLKPLQTTASEISGRLVRARAETVNGNHDFDNHYGCLFTSHLCLFKGLIIGYL